MPKAGVGTRKDVEGHKEVVGLVLFLSLALDSCMVGYKLSKLSYKVKDKIDKICSGFVLFDSSKLLVGLI